MSNYSPFVGLRLAFSFPSIERTPCAGRPQAFIGNRINFMTVDPFVNLINDCSEGWRDSVCVFAHVSVLLLPCGCGILKKDINMHSLHFYSVYSYQVLLDDSGKQRAGCEILSSLRKAAHETSRASFSFAPEASWGVDSSRIHHKFLTAAVGTNGSRWQGKMI